MKKSAILSNLFFVATGTLTAIPSPAFSQAQTGAAPQASPDDIVVTARKRDETSIAVPVALTAVGGAELDRRAIATIDGLARVVPSLITGDNASQQGGIVAIRGLAGADTNPFGDQAVSFNVDGVQVARASIRRMSETDIQQIEILKGPQALFFGKNSPAGVISIRTANPTSTLQAKISAGYEFKADEIRTEGYISGPITDTLGFRVAGFYSDMKGWSTNIGPRTGTNVFPSVGTRAPNGTDLAGRVTLKWEPSDRFDAKLKLNYGKVRNNGPTANNQLVSCPLGVPQGSTAVDDCKADDQVTTGSIGPNFGNTDARFGDGDTFFHQRQILGGLEMNYKLNDNLQLTSVTGYYHLWMNYIGNFTNNFFESGAPPRQILGSWAKLRLRETTEELRLTSSFDGPVNFMIGGLYQDSHGYEELVTYRNALTPAFINNLIYVQDGTAYSIFGQAMANLLPTVELSVGGRYSYEKKKLPVALAAVAAAPTVLLDINGPNFPREISFNNLSPEATLSWRPSRDLTVYGSYKEGFLSGGFNANNPTGIVSVAPSLTVTGASDYHQQTIRGFEIGAKAALFGGALRTNIALYNYKTNGLQVTVTTQGTQVELRNAGSVRTKGVEFDFNYRTPLPGLTLNGAVNYNRGKYLDYQASCYRGQSSATCFNQVNRVTGQIGLLQDLSGTELVRAPKWTGNLGFNYEAPISQSLKIGVSANGSHSDAYFTDVTSKPGGRQKGYELYDATLRVGAADDRWEVALIGRNLTDEYYFARSTDVPFTGSAPGAASVGTFGDTAAVVNRGREVLVRLSLKFGE